MIRFFLLSALILGTLATTAQQNIDTVSYSIGLNVGLRLKSQGATALDYESMVQAIKDVLENEKTILSRKQSDSINYVYFENQRNLIFTKVKQEGEEFLAKNGQRPEVITTESGLQYEVLTEGTGLKPTGSSSVTVHYTGTFLNGDLFDSSVERGSKATFGVNQVIAGWTEGLQLMGTGSKYKFYIPFDLGYGPRGYGHDIPPYSTLIFEVELFDFQ